MRTTDKIVSKVSDGRGQTDSSLVRERGKTDESFAEYRKQTESETDQRVKTDRKVVDDARTQSRIDADATTDLGRSGRTKIRKNRTTVEISADNDLSAQRDLDDAAIHSERSSMDEALIHKREINDAKSYKFLDRERKETDKNLLHERSHTDVEAVSSTKRFQELHDFIMQSPSAMVILLGKHHYFSVANPAYERIVGRKVVGKTLLEAFTEEEVGHFLPRLDGVYQSGSPYIGKEIHLNIPGENGEIEEHFVNIGYHPFRDGEGAIRGITASVQDVTEQVVSRKRAEESEAKLVESQARFKFATDAGRLGTWYVNLPEGTLTVNEITRVLHGIKETDKVQDVISGRTHPDDRARHQNAFEDSSLSGKPFDIEYRVLHTDGDYRWVHARGEPKLDQSGLITSVAGIVVDVTKEREAREQLSNAKASLEVERNNFERLSEQSSGFVAIFDGPEFVYDYGNTTNNEILGGDFTGKRIEDVIPDVKRSGLLTQLKNVYQTGKPEFIHELPLIVNGNHRYFNATYVSRENADGGIDGVATWGMDVTEQVGARKQLEESEARYRESKKAAEVANEAKSAFLANMSHEIRTPLGAIMGFSELARQPGATREEIANYLSIVERNSSQVLNIIDDILDLAKVEAGRVELESIDIRLTEFLADFASLMGFRARENGITFKLTAETDLPDRICTDPTRLRQILTNAVNNAIKFTAKSSVHLHISFKESRLEFEITDTGRGISKEQASNLFQAFVQADASTTRNYGGTGLGLVLTKRLCELMGGDYVLQASELGVGSEFLATILPKFPDSSQMVSKNKVEFKSLTHALKSLQPGRLDKIRVLLVEDSPDNQILIRLILEKQGADLTIASDGAEGVEKALNSTFDVVLMDIQMPNMDGHEATQRLRSLGYKKPIVALTAHAMKEESERAERSGFTTFLTKPIQRESLIDAVRELAVIDRPKLDH